MKQEAKLVVDTFGSYIDGCYAAWAREHLGEDAAARLKTDFADLLSEPLAAISAWRIETWRRDQLDSLVQPPIISRRLQALDSCLNKAVEWLLVERNPMQDVRVDAEAEYFVELFAGGVGHGYLREGWAPVGVNWTWTLGKRAVVELPPVSGETDYVLKMRIGGTYKENPQRLFVDVNETAVGILLCRGPATYEFFVPACALNSRDRVNVVLKIPDALRPMDHEESKDNRFLGFRVARIDFQSMAKSQQQRQLPQSATDELPPVLTQRAALQDMASLGFNCEFGFVQRYVGAEPMGLLRWAFVPIDKLIAGLENRFAGLTARDALEVKVHPSGEFVVEDKIYGFRHHTFVFAFRGGELERVQRNEFIRVGVLCKTLLEELREHKKLFVYHDAGASTLEDIRRLVRALQIYGNNTLLWIVAAPTPAQIGETRQIERGLIQGYVSGFQSEPIGPRSPHLSSWIKVACRAHEIWNMAQESEKQTRQEKQIRQEKQLQAVHK